MKIIVNKILGTVSLLLLCNKAEKYPKKFQNLTVCIMQVYLV